jgi:LPS export ABC transporter protein LptC
MKKTVKPAPACAMAVFTAVFLVCSCTFDYGETESSERNLPDLVMEDVEYVRVRSANPIARFSAERAESYEKQGLMKLEKFSFEQYGDRGETTNVAGRAGNASVYIDTGDIFMENGVKLEVESEDIVIETMQINWIDNQRVLSSGEENEVYIYQQNGTSFTGIGLRADARRRTWEFSGPVSGTYVHQENNSGDE